VLGVKLPKHAKKELDAYLDCGLLCRGFARLKCDQCAESRLVAFSCKGRGFCPSCMGRRMCATSAQLIGRTVNRNARRISAFAIAVKTIRAIYTREASSTASSRNASKSASDSSCGGGVGSGTGGTGTGGSGTIPPITDFTMGWKLGQPVTGAGVRDTGLGGTDCSIVVGVVRDFKGKNEPGGHADFESYIGNGPMVGLVGGGLGTDGKPLYASTCEGAGMSAACPDGQQTSGKANFDQWFRYTDGVNKPYLLYLLFNRMGGISTFGSGYFFPLDNAGWGSLAYANDFKQHNFGFTFELHTKFKYNGGETLQVEVDDDLWVFINGKLALDLGGLHLPAKGMVNLDTSAAALGLTRGSVYLLELFHAERHTTVSSFGIDTTLTFVDCGIIPPDVP
jgi:fibro-slime domain-containing protein